MGPLQRTTGSSPNGASLEIAANDRGRDSENIVLNSEVHVLGAILG